MGVIVKPKNLNDRQMKRVDRIEESNPLRARTVANRISARRDARGAENPQISKAIEARRSMAQPMKKGGSMKKAQNGGGVDKNVKSKQLEMKQKAQKPMGMNFDKKSFDSLPKLKKAKNGSSFGMLSVKAGVDKNPNPTAADRIAGAKGMAKKGAKVATKKYKSGGTVSMQLGSYTRQIGKNYIGKNVVNKGAKAKMGKSMGKCKNGC